MNEQFLESLNIINTLSDQIEAILDLMQMADNSTDVKSMNTAAEMCLVMHTEIMIEVRKIEKLWRHSDE